MRAQMVFLLIAILAASPATAQIVDAVTKSRNADLSKPTESREAAAEDAGLVQFEHSPFPFEGMIPEQNKPFLDRGQDGRAFHIAPRGGKLYADKTYSDRRSLLVLTPAFDPAKPDAAIVLFFHGNLATLGDVRGRQAVPRQLIASGMNAVLVAPQLAVNALDSSPGHFYDQGFFETYLHEAAEHLAEKSKGRLRAQDLDRLPIVIVAYSGGYLAAAFSLNYETERSRIRGVVFLDALFGEEEKVRDWIEHRHPSIFFVDAYSKASGALSSRLKLDLQRHNIPVRSGLPPAIRAGDVIFQPAPAAPHNDFVTRAWTNDPLKIVLGRISLNALADKAPAPQRDIEAPTRPARTDMSFAHDNTDKDRKMHQTKPKPNPIIKKPSLRVGNCKAAATGSCARPQAQ